MEMFCAIEKMHWLSHSRIMKRPIKLKEMLHVSPSQRDMVPILDHFYNTSICNVFHTKECISYLIALFIKTNALELSLLVDVGKCFCLMCFFS